MYLIRKPIGDIFNREYVWVGKKGGFDVIVRFDGESSLYWFALNRDGTEVYNSLTHHIGYGNLDNASKEIEIWIEENLLGKKKKPVKLSQDVKYSILLQSVKKVCMENPSARFAKDLKDTLEKIGEV